MMVRLKSRGKKRNRGRLGEVVKGVGEIACAKKDF